MRRVHNMTDARDGKSRHDDDYLLDLLQFVTGSVHQLLDATDFEFALNNWLRAITLHVGSARASFMQIGTHSSGVDTLNVTAEWARPELAGSISASFAEPWVIDPRGAEDLMGDILQGRYAEFHVVNTTAQARDFLIAQGNASVLIMPIVIHGKPWGGICLDFLTHQIFSPRYIAIMQTAADTLASVINRNQVQTQLVAEQKTRADENADLAKLLEAVARASRKLIAEPDFESGVMAYLQIVATALNAARATFYDYRWHAEADRISIAALCEWSRPDVSNNISFSFSNPLVIDPRGSEWLVDESIRGELTVVQTDETDGPNREFLEAQGNATVIAVPVIVGGQSMYSISFDSLTRRELDPQTQRVLEMAADAMSAAVKRWDIEKRLREAEAERIDEQRARAHAAERHGELLQAVVSTSEMLLKAQNMREVANDVIAQIGRVLSADRCTIGLYLPPDEKDISGYIDFDYEWVAAGVARQTDQAGLKVFAMSQYLDFLRPLQRGEAIPIITDEIMDTAARDEQVLTGAKSQFQHPIMVDGKFWGCLGADDCHTPRVWSATEIDSLRLVASALAAVVKREQLTEARIEAERERESAKRASQIAVAGERNRIARDIHDTLAQGFTGVIMQSQAAEYALQKQDSPAAVHHMYRARTIAQSSLHDARRSVFALRPSILIDQTLAQALRSQLTRMLVDAKTTGGVEESGVAVAPSNLVATELLRIAQEATNNVLRHAHAQHIKIRLQWSTDSVTLAIEDDGQGFNALKEHPGFGLVSMRERADRMDAALVIDSRAQAGTSIHVTVDPRAGGGFVERNEIAVSEKST